MEVAAANIEAKTRRLVELRDRLSRMLTSAIPDANVNAEQVERLPNTLSIRFPGDVPAQALSARVVLSDDADVGVEVESLDNDGVGLGW